MNKVYVKHSYITNFRPKAVFSKISLKKSKKNNNTIIHCKNFLIFLLLLKLTELEQNTKISFFIKKNSQNTITSLRAPYRHKLARHQFSIQRYSINTVFSFVLNKQIKLNTYAELLYFSKTAMNIKSMFETNIVYQHRIHVSFEFFFKNNFILTNYK